MDNVMRALNMLRAAGYKAESIHDHTVVITDRVQCSSGKLQWTEYREVPINVAHGLYRVANFINERE